jgi:hypothetical protein
MKDAIKLILEILSLGKSIYKEYKKVKDASKRKAIRKAIKEKDLDALRRLNLGRNIKP